MGVSYTTNLARGTVEAGVDATYIPSHDFQFTSASPVVERLNTPYNPVDLKLRRRAVLGQGGLSLAGFFNYVDSYTDDRGPESLPIESWPTVDARMGYQITSANGLLDGLSAMVSVINITDADPPFVASNGEVGPASIATVPTPAH